MCMSGIRLSSTPVIPRPRPPGHGSPPHSRPHRGQAVRAAPPWRASPRSAGAVQPRSRRRQRDGLCAPRAAGTAFNTGHVARRTSPSNSQCGARPRRRPAGSRSAGRERRRGRRGPGPSPSYASGCCTFGWTGRSDPHQRGLGAAAQPGRFCRAVSLMCAPVWPATPGKDPRIGPP